MAAHMAETLREDLRARWTESHRKHHTVNHLHEMLDAIGALAGAGIEFDREAVELAAWFHDTVYEIGRDDNEDRSAELARELLAASPARDEVARSYAAAVREEYADIPNSVFRPARAQVLSPLLDGPIFHTAPGRARLVQRARTGPSVVTATSPTKPWPAHRTTAWSNPAAGAPENAKTPLPNGSPTPPR